MRPTPALFAAASFITLSGCKTWDASQAPTPEVETPEAFTAPMKTELDTSLVEDGWLKDFQSEELDALVAEALENNPSILGSLAALDAAFFNARIAGARLYPSIGIDGRVGRSRTNTSLGAIYNDSSSLTGQLSWEIDLWGRVRDGKKAAEFDFAASEADYTSSRLSLAADVTRLWIRTIAAKQQLDLSIRTLESFENNEEIIQSRFERGISTAFELQSVRSRAASTRASVAQNRDDLDELVRTLEILLGRYPSGALAVGESLPAVLEPVPAGLPSELLERRPDILRASALLDASAYRQAQAHKNRLPSFSLTGSFGRSSFELNELADPNFTVWSLFGNLGTTLFNFGRLEAEQDRATAQFVQSGHAYMSTVLRAFFEVESALNSEVLIAERLEAQRAAAKASTDAETISWERYQSGLEDITAVLSAQRNADTERRSLISQESAYLLNRVNLHLALGGDFEVSPPETP